MRNSENVLISLAKHSGNKDYKYERLYRLLFNEAMYLCAYQKIYANKGNMTKGTDNQTIDGMSLKRIEKIIVSLKDESYKPKPSRRTYIPKKNGKMRPLGIPSFEDKLLQEVIRMILEAIYEGYFEETSHGFRPNKSCHTVLTKIQNTFTGVKWFIEGDIKGFFDNINHSVMISILSERIIDERFIRLIRKFLNAGYMEDWTYHKTFTGCPQGGIISPILANIYLDKFDKYMKEYKRLTYIRYADDWLCGVIGSKEDCSKIKEDIKNFLTEKLQLELSEEKTLITNAKDRADFLGYKIYVRQSNLSKRDKIGKLVRNYTGRVVLEISTDIIKKRLLDYGAMKLTYHQGKEIWKAKARYSLKDCDDLEILDHYNAEIRGFYNYYSIANNSSIINSFKYIMEYSMYKTYATKYRTQKSKIIAKYRVGKDFGVKYKNAKGVEITRLFYNEGFKRKKKSSYKDVDVIPDGIKFLGGTSLITRLRANKCENCGKLD